MSGPSPAERIVDLRAAMKNSGVQAYVAFNTDPHKSEYLAKHFKRIAFLSGFTGSNATIVVPEDTE